MSIVEVSLGSTAQLLDVVEGRKTDPLYRAQRLLTKAHERHDKGYSELAGLLAAGDPNREVRTAWHANQVVRSICDVSDAARRVRKLHHNVDHGVRVDGRSGYRPPLPW